jgi:hypothetical protein
MSKWKAMAWFLICGLSGSALILTATEGDWAEMEIVAILLLMSILLLLSSEEK